MGGVGVEVSVESGVQSAQGGHQGQSDLDLRGVGVGMGE